MIVNTVTFLTSVYEKRGRIDLKHILGNRTDMGFEDRLCHLLTVCP